MYALQPFPKEFMCENSQVSPLMTAAYIAIVPKSVCHGIQFHVLVGMFVALLHGFVQRVPINHEL